MPVSHAFANGWPRRMRTAACLVGAAMLATEAGAEQGVAVSAVDLDAVVEPLLAGIEQEEARNGQFSQTLVELLMALGLAYQEHGEHALALSVLDRAFYLQRFNEGLHTLDQVPLVRRLIESELAVGRAAGAAELENRLVELARRNPDDVRSVSIFREAAERQLDYYERYLRRELPPAAGVAVNDANGPERSAAFSVREARRNYHAAIAALVRSGEYGHPELADLEQELTRTYYLEASSRRAGSLDPNDFATVQKELLYGLGRSSYQRRVRYSALGSPSAVERARALVELADWSLVFSRNGTAVKGYEQAHALLVAQRVPEAAIRELFPTDVPVFVPTFARNPLDAVANPKAAGYVDLDFEIGRYGQPRKTRIVAVAGEAAAASAKQVAAIIQRSRFRPSPLAETKRATTYRVRYSLADGSVTPRL